MNFTFLSMDEILGDSALDVLRWYGPRVAPTDMAVLLGAAMESMPGRTGDGYGSCSSWTRSCRMDSVVVISDSGRWRTTGPLARFVAARPVLPPSEVEKICPITRKVIDGFRVVEYGRYPQMVALKDESKILEGLYILGSLATTGKTYTFDLGSDLGDFRGTVYQEYILDENRYIRIPGCPCDSNSKLSNGEQVEKGKPYWVKVQPILWLMDRTGYMISHKCLFAGIQFDRNSNYYGNFSGTFMKHYLDNFFAKEIGAVDRTAGTSYSDKISEIFDYAARMAAASKYEEDIDDEDFDDFEYEEPRHADRMAGRSVSGYREESRPADRMAGRTASGYREEPRPVDRMADRTAYGYRGNIQNPVMQNQQSPRQKKYGISVSEEPMSVKEQISFYVQNGMSFMLHGPSGVGKSQRVKEIDPNLTSITLCNGILPEDVIGKTIYPNGVGADAASGGVWVSPKWYTDLCKKCETEPDKQHVLFIDEVTNARETTQSMIYHVALEKSIAQGVGKLPQNAVVVLAGNSKEESGAAYNMPAPLFRRLSHIYLDLNIQDWLEWGSEHSKSHPEDSERLNIHPLIASFVAANGKKVFYSEYDEEDPPKYALDPRKWEKVSDKIYANKGVVRREILESDIGTDLAATLLAYAKNPPLTLEDVVNGNYTERDIPRTPDACLALTLSLRYATPKQVGTVRAFIQDYLGAENRAIFDSVWIGKDDARAMQIAGLSRLLKEQRGR